MVSPLFRLDCRLAGPLLHATATAPVYASVDWNRCWPPGPLIQQNDRSSISYARPDNPMPPCTTAVAIVCQPKKSDTLISGWRMTDDRFSRGKAVRRNGRSITDASRMIACPPCDLACSWPDRCWGTHGAGADRLDPSSQTGNYDAQSVRPAGKAARPEHGGFQAHEPSRIHTGVKHLSQMAKEIARRYLFIALVPCDGAGLPAPIQGLDRGQRPAVPLGPLARQPDAYPHYTPRQRQGIHGSSL